MNEIYEILKEVRPENDFENSDDFIADALLDSFDIITIIDIIQEKYNILIDGLEIVPENFCSAAAIKALVDKKKL